MRVRGGSGLRMKYAVPRFKDELPITAGALLRYQQLRNSQPASLQLPVYVCGRCIQFSTAAIH